MAVKLEKYQHNYTSWGRQVLKSQQIVPVLKRQLNGPTTVMYRGNRITVQVKSQNVMQSPQANARAIMRKAKTPKQKAYARYLFSKLDNK